LRGRAVVHIAAVRENANLRTHETKKVRQIGLLEGAPKEGGGEIPLLPVTPLPFAGGWSHVIPLTSRDR
jgi:hypothetical protein